MIRCIKGMFLGPLPNPALRHKEKEPVSHPCTGASRLPLSCPWFPEKSDIHKGMEVCRGERQLLEIQCLGFVGWVCRLWAQRHPGPQQDLCWATRRGDWAKPCSPRSVWNWPRDGPSCQREGVQKPSFIPLQAELAWCGAMGGSTCSC